MKSLVVTVGTLVAAFSVGVGTGIVVPKTIAKAKAKKKADNTKEA